MLHERRFKLVLKGLFILITVCVVLFFVWDHIIEPGVNFRGMDFLTGDMLVELENGKADTIFFLIGSGATALPKVVFWPFYLFCIF